jgi:uncharacterized glyoxalase superfamily protein PhnB
VSESQYPNSVHLTVASVVRSARFYREKFGFRLVEALPDTKKPVWANVRLGAQSVMLGQLPSLEEARRLGKDRAEIELLKKDARTFAAGSLGVGVLIYLRVDDVDAYHKRLRRKRVVPLTRLKTQSYGIRDFQVEDPDGYRLVFYAPAAVTALAFAATGP